MGGSISRKALSGSPVAARINRLFSELTGQISSLSDEQVAHVLGRGNIDALLKAILDPSKLKEKRKIGEIFLENKRRLELLALMRHAITHNYVTTSDKNPDVFASPFHLQWIDDGVVYVEGKERFAGHFGLYRNGEVFVAVAARDAEEGSQLDLKRDITFVPISEARAIWQKLSAAQLEGPQSPSEKLRALLQADINEEGAYQEVLEGAPWALGMQYRKIQCHKALDDENIPDFTGVRSHDGFRDVIEVKPPFMKIFRADGRNFIQEFNDALNQAERYLDFVDNNRDYLSRAKGLIFENASCTLICGYALDPEGQKLLRAKERALNGRLHIRTYDQILSLMDNTMQKLRELKASDGNEGE